MTTIKEVFNQEKGFIGFLTLGDTNFDDTEKKISILLENGVNILELGIPFSDPSADGPIIQDADNRALKNNYSQDQYFEFISKIHQQYQVPIVILTYMNPIFHYGYDKYFETCQNAGVQALVIPDLPFEEQGELKPYSDKYSIDLITLIAPSSQDRIEKLAAPSQGFIYLVSSLGVTGTRSNISTDLSQIVTQIRSVSKTPIAVGFGISTPEQAKEIAQVSDGIIIGSKIVDIAHNQIENLQPFIASISQAIK